MSDQEFPDDYPLTVDDFEAHHEGEEFTAYEDSDTFECDFCSKHVTYASEPRVGQYHADQLLATPNEKARQVNDQRALVPLATYCPDCSLSRLFFPCQGFTELRVMATLTPDKRTVDFDVTDVSPADDGIPWNPRELSESITGIPFDLHVSQSGSDMFWGAENMVTFFLSVGAGIDIRELVKWDGSIDGKMLGQARRKYSEFQDEMQRAKQRGGRSEHRRQFSKRVRGDDK